MTYGDRYARSGRNTRRLLLAGAAFCTFGVSAALAQSVNLSIPEEPLAQSLKDVARQTSKNILFTPDAVAGLRAHALSGPMTAEQAVDSLISGTGLEAVPDGSGGLIVRKHSKTAQAEPGASPIETIVVTGTHIAGEGPVGSDVIVYSRDDLDRSGAGTLDQFARQVPQNLSDIDSVSNMASNYMLAARPGGDSNNNSGAAFNLQGLGVTSTLTLVNGHRVAAGGSIGSFTDISMIPFSAVDHVEILDDGASSIYGSDAVAGVVNIIMRNDYDGAETTLRYGGATEGGADEFTASQLLGKSWSTGNVLLNYEYDDNSGIDASQRSYIPDQGGKDTLFPEARRTSLFFQGNQEIDLDTNVFGEAFYSHKNTYFDQSQSSAFEQVFITQPGSVTVDGGVVSIDHSFWDDWKVSLTGDYSKEDQRFDQTEIVNIPGVFTGSATGTSRPKTMTKGIDGLVTGTLFSLPAGDAKIAFGGSYRAETYASASVLTVGSVTTFVETPTYRRHIESVYGEMVVPLIGDANALPYLRRLEVSGAVRYDDYSVFGSSTNPKVGIVAAPTDDFSLRGTWGTSFRAPLLIEADSPVQYQAEFLPNPAAPGGATDTLLVAGGNMGLKPETATVYTTGADWHPHWDEGLTISATYANVSYKGLIGLPPITNLGAVFSDPELTPFIDLSPDPAFVAAAFASPNFGIDYTHAGPGAVQAILYDRYSNLAAEKESSLDFRLTHLFSTDLGQFTFMGEMNASLSNTLQSAPTAPSINIANTFGEPSRWKGRANLTYAKGGFVAAATLNWVNAYNDTLAVPTTRIGAWTTADLYLGYSLSTADAGAWFGNMRFGLTVQNIFDTRPPYVLIPPGDLLPGQNPYPVDAVNASPVGRLIAFQVTKDL